MTIMNQIKIDNYTKSVLTIIAVCLTILTLKQLDLVPKAYAGEATKHKTAPSSNYGLVPLNEDGSITVKLSSSDEMDVNIVGVDTYDELDVNIEEIGGGHVSHGGPISVEVE
jgi:hypothetical protein